MARVISIGPFVPYEGIDHAGGEYLLRHLSVLAEDHEVTVVAPATPKNSSVAGVSPVASILVPRSAAWLSRAMTPLRGIANVVKGPTLGIDFERALRRTPQITSLLASADLIELQWTETAGLSRYVRRIAPGVPQVVIAYDMLVQKLDRRWRAERNPALRVFHRLRATAWGRDERRMLQGIDYLIVFSEKDAAIARGLVPGIDVSVLRPPLEDPTMPQVPREQPGSRRALFAAAFAREENQESAEWLLAKVWPVVRASVPDATLVLAGSGPSARLRGLADAAGGVEVTGFVPSLDPYYVSSDIAVVPLVRGAGVKFKTIIAMLWGLPVVATAIGAEGVGDPSRYAAVADDAAGFADAVITALSDPAALAPLADSTFTWAHDVYSQKTFARSLRELVARATGDKRS